MPKTILKLLLGFVLLIVIALQACAPGVATPDPDSINTAIARTLEAALTQTSQPGIPVTGDKSPTPTSSPVPPSPTPTPSATLTPIPTSTPAVPGVPQVSVSVPTNCRVGPGQVYDRVGGLLAGEVAEVVGRHATRDYWVIRNPDGAGTCWLWGEFATVTGDTSALPVFTPPPTPTPAAAFDVFYEGLEVCPNIGWWLDLNVENLGGITFMSMALTMQDLDTNVSLSHFAEGFTDRDGCIETETVSTLPPAADRIVSSPVFNYDIRGHRLRTTITLCSNPEQSGTCVTNVFNFRP